MFHFNHPSAKTFHRNRLQSYSIITCILSLAMQMLISTDDWCTSDLWMKRPTFLYFLCKCQFSAGNNLQFSAFTYIHNRDWANEYVSILLYPVGFFPNFFLRRKISYYPEVRVGGEIVFRSSAFHDLWHENIKFIGINIHIFQQKNSLFSTWWRENYKKMD